MYGITVESPVVGNMFTRELGGYRGVCSTSSSKEVISVHLSIHVSGLELYNPCDASDELVVNTCKASATYLSQQDFPADCFSGNTQRALTVTQ